MRRSIELVGFSLLEFDQNADAIDYRTNSSDQMEKIIIKKLRKSKKCLKLKEKIKKLNELNYKMIKWKKKIKEMENNGK